MKLSDYLARYLWENGCTHIFGYTGGAVTHIIDSIYKRDDIRFIQSYHEQAAAFAAEGYARIKNTIGVTVATSGPGATNLTTGIGSAFFDSIPCLYITGQVNTYEYKGELKIRQMGFQETDIVSIVKPITKYAIRITDPMKIKYELDKAMYIAQAGRKGPVLLDIPMDIQRADIESALLEDYVPERAEQPCLQPHIESITNALKAAERPVILIGGGIRLSGSARIFGRLAEKLRIPVVSTLMGRDAYDNSNENYCGMIGAYGNRYANYAVANADCILALGTRLDSRQTGTDPANFAREAKLIRVDTDKDQLDLKIKRDEYSVQSDLSEFLKQLNGCMPEPNVSKTWLESVKTYKESYPSFTEKTADDPNYIMHRISQMLGPDDTVCLDVGQNQMWAAQSMRIVKNQRLLISGGMGAMGFSLPAAIGVYYAQSGGRVFAVAGDGGFQINIQELALIKRNNIPIKMIILNNRSLGMIRHFQEMYFEGRFYATLEGYESPDFCRIAEAYGIHSVRISELSGLDSLQEIFQSDRPEVIEIILPLFTYVFPKLSVNRPIEEQEPLLKREEHLRNMHIPVFKPKKEDNPE